jgi:organic anion transporter 4A
MRPKRISFQINNASLNKGTLFGALLVSKYNWDAAACAKVASVYYFFTSFFFLIMLLSCPEIKFTKGNVLTSQPSFLLSCNCDNIYDPVCFINNSKILTYQSPCHAGCTSYASRSQYTDCACLTGLGNSTANYISISSCDSAIKCTTFMLIGIAGALIIVFFSGAAVIPHLKAMLGSLETEQQSFGLGIKTGITRILGNVTGPLIYGLAVDSSCKIWKQNCYNQQKCEQYDNTRLSMLMSLISFGSRFGTFIFVFLAFYFLRKQRSEKSFAPASLESIATIAATMAKEPPTQISTKRIAVSAASQKSIISHEPNDIKVMVKVNLAFSNDSESRC